MDKINISAVRHDGETWSLVVLALMSLGFLGLLLASVVGAIWLAAFLAIEMVAHRMTMAFFRANSVKVTESQYPVLYRMVADYSQKLGLKKEPQVYIIQQTILNAFATRVARRNVVVVYSHTVETMLEDNSTDALGMVLAHEIGHLVANHLRWGSLIGCTGVLFPPLFLYWSRCCEYTADRLAYLCLEDKEGAFQGLLKLTVGKKMAPDTNLEAFNLQHEELRKDWLATIVQFFSTHPHLVNRFFMLQAFARIQDRKSPGLKQGEGVSI